MPHRRCSKNQLAEKLYAVQAAHPQQRVQVWAQDEARFGLKGSLCRLWAPRGSCLRRPRQTEYGHLYCFGSVCCDNGQRWQQRSRGHRLLDRAFFLLREQL
jgi:hypothetical protein